MRHGKHSAPANNETCTTVMPEEQINITRRATRRLSLRIGRGGEIRVSAPWFASQSQIRKFVEANAEWISKARERARLNEERQNSFYGKLPLRSKQEKLEATRRLSEIIVPLYERYSREMGIAAKMQIVFSATKSKWGSCCPKRGKIQFSLYLLLLPEWCIESVVVHELCHVYEMNHGPHFYALMDKFFPRWKEARATIKMAMNQ